MNETNELLFEIGCEELPASFVAGALDALPKLAAERLAALRLGYASLKVVGTPRRLALMVSELQAQQEDLAEQVTGPPVKAAFRDGEPTRAALAFAKKLGCEVADLERFETPKGEYLRGMRHEEGRPARALLPEMLAELTTSIPFRKSMRWGEGSLTFGRPIRWLVALLDGERMPVPLQGVASVHHSYGHRFLHPDAVELKGPADYLDALRKAHVIADPSERRELMIKRLHSAAAEAGGELIEDEFLVGENLSLVEDPQVVTGQFEEEFLELPEGVILEVARGHQRYFCLRDKAGKLLPKYLAVVNTAEHPEKIRLGNDRVMRARLADARFFLKEDLKQSLIERRDDLKGIVFQKRLGTVLAKVERIERLTDALAAMVGADEATRATAVRAAHLCKCDLVTLMVGEFPDLQGAVGRSYALRQGEPEAVAKAIEGHYHPKGAKDAAADNDAAALVAMADRIDTLVGCFAIGLAPTGAADPYALRRACIGSLRTIMERGFAFSVDSALEAAYRLYEDVAIDVDQAALAAALGTFFRDRLRHLLGDSLPHDVVDAALGVAANRPLDAVARANAILQLEPDVRAKVGEVFKRATNIAKTAPDGEPEKGSEPMEVELFDAFADMRVELAQLSEAGNYVAAFAKVASLAPVLGRYFDDVLVMAQEQAVRDNRLRLMRAISQACGGLARLEVLGGEAS